MVDIKVNVILTFDDGPRDGYKTILEKLSSRKHPIDGVKRPIAAAFFLQNCQLGNSTKGFEGKDRYKRGVEIHQSKHLVAIHTGSLDDHTCHRVRVKKPFETTNHKVNPKAPAGWNALDSDMIRAKATLKKITGNDPKFVRAAHGHTDAAVIAVYKRQNLENVHWHADSGDTHGISWEKIPAEIKKEIKRVYKKETIVFLFHDKAPTQKNLDLYIDTIETALKSHGRVAVYPSDAEGVSKGLMSAVGEGIFEKQCTHIKKPTSKSKQKAKAAENASLTVS